MAETLQGAELEAASKLIGHDAPEYPKYKTKTDREMPLIRLRAVGG